jgi:FlaA1/EpsC-like NDP-sugar epimerase
MLSDSTSPLIPVGVLDDDPRMLRHRLVRGVEVLAPGSAMAEVAGATGAQVLVIAIPSAPPELVRSVTAAAEAAGLEVRVVPPRWAMTDETVNVGAVRPVSLEDLLDRPAHDLDIAAIADYVVGARILVTGAGGSIGSELCRQLSRWAPADLVMLDRDESALHTVSLSLDDEARLDDDSLVVADIRDRDRLDEVFARCRPQVVFHAAALKHVPLLELHPAEAVKTNVLGTANVLEAARAVGAERVINISTDKAADPENVLGYTKCIGEKLTAGVGQHAEGAWVSVRFGNVLGSRGSVLTTFQHQLDAGKPLTVTHADVTRYFMTVEEAVQLVIQAGAIGENGDVLVLEMGEPVRIADVARRMAESVDPPLEVEVTGLRPGEKLNETLFAAHEVPGPTGHQAISRVRSGVLPPESLNGLATATPDLVACLRECCGRAPAQAGQSSAP